MRYLSSITAAVLAAVILAGGSFADEKDPWITHYNAAFAASRNRDFRSASDSLTKALDIALSGPENDFKIQESIRLLVQALLAQEKYSEARQACDKLIAYYQRLADEARKKNNSHNETSYLFKLQKISTGIYRSIPYEEKPPSTASLMFPYSQPSADTSSYKFALPQTRLFMIPDNQGAAPPAPSRVQLDVPKDADPESPVTITGLDSIGAPADLHTSLTRDNAPAPSTNSAASSRTPPQVSLSVPTNTGAEDIAPQENDFAADKLPEPVRFPHSLETATPFETPLGLPESSSTSALGAAAKEKASAWASKANVALIEAKHGNYELAATTSLDALKLAEQIGLNDERVAISQIQYGNILLLQGKYADAEQLLQRGTALTERLYGPNNKNTANALQALGLVKLRTCDYSLATSILQRALSIRESQVGAESPLLFSLTDSLAAAYLAQGKLAESEVLLTRNLRVAERSIGPKSHLTASALGNLSRLYDEQKKYKEALELAEHALNIDDAALGADNKQIATHLNNIATLKMHMQEFKAAEAYLQRALAIQPKDDQSAILHNMGALYLHEARFKEAAESLQKAVSRDQLPEYHPQTIQMKIDLSAVYGHQGRFDKAEALLKDVLVQKQKTQGTTNPEVVRLRRNIAALALAKQGDLAGAQRAAYPKPTNKEHKASTGEPPTKAFDSAAKADATNDIVRSAELYFQRGNFAKAQQLFKQAIAVYEKSSPNNPKLILPLQGSGSCYMRQDNFSEAEGPFKRALAVTEQSTGADSEATAKALESLVTMYLRAQMRVEALPLLKRATTIAEKRKNAKLQLNLLICQAEWTRQEGQTAEAEALCKRALPIIATKQEYAPAFNKVYYCLYQICFKQEKYEEAATYLKKAMKSQEKLAGKTNRDYATMIGTYGQLLLKQGKHAEAQDALKQSIAIREAVTGDDPQVAVNLIELGELYLNHGQYAESATVCKRALSIYEKHLAPDDQKLGQLLSNIGAVYARQGDYTAALPYCKRALDVFTQNGFIRTPIGVSFTKFYAEVAGKASVSP